MAALAVRVVNMTQETYRELNLASRSGASSEEYLGRFRRLSEDEQQEAIRSLTLMILQAGGRDQDVDPAIERSGVPSTHTPAVVLKTERHALKNRLNKVRLLPGDEREKAMRLLLEFFAIADERRRSFCGNSCSHWWHHI